MLNNPICRPIILLLWIVCVVASGCADLLLQNDGFAAKIPTSCATEEACEMARVEAENRVTRCQPNTVGYVRCADAQADLHTIDGHILRIRRARQEKREQAERQRAEAERRRAEDERETAAVEAARQKRAQQAAEAVERARKEWHAAAVKVCVDGPSSDACDTSQAEVTSEDKAACRRQCDENITKLRYDAIQTALYQCVGRYTDSKGQKPSKCDIASPMSPRAAISTQMATECSAACVERGKSELKARREAEANARREAIASAAEAGSDDSGGWSGSSGGGSVHIRGYTRKDGTHVRPHTRSSPRRR